MVERSTAGSGGIGKFATVCNRPTILRSAAAPFGFVWFFAKVGLVLFVFIWLRGTLPRFRYDQLMHFGWKVLIPLAVLSILVTAARVVVFR